MDQWFIVFSLFTFIQVSESTISITSLDAVNTQSLQVSWTLDSTVDMSCCTVMWTPTEGVVHVNNITNTADITGLTAGRNYTVQVCANYSTGEQCSTENMNNTYPAKPNYLHLVEAQSTKLIIQWSQEGDITNVTIEAVTDDLVQKAYDELNLINHTVSIAGLLAGFLYNTTLITVSGVLHSNPSDVAQFRTRPPEPSSVYCSSNSTSNLTVYIIPSTWKSYLLDSYLIQYSASSNCTVSGSELTKHAVPNVSETVELSGLSAGTVYNMCVYSCSDDTLSETSVDQSCATRDYESTTDQQLSTTGNYDSTTTQQDSHTTTTTTTTERESTVIYTTTTTTDGITTDQTSTQFTDVSTHPPTAKQQTTLDSSTAADQTSAQTHTMLVSSTEADHTVTQTTDTHTTLVSSTEPNQTLMTPTSNDTTELATTLAAATTTATTTLLTTEDNISLAAVTTSPVHQTTTTITFQPPATTPTELVTLTTVPPDNSTSSSSNAWIAGVVVGSVVAAAATTAVVYVAVMHSLSQSYSFSGMENLVEDPASYAPRYSYAFPEMSDVNMYDELHAVDMSTNPGNGHVTHITSGV